MAVLRADPILDLAYDLEASLHAQGWDLQPACWGVYRSPTGQTPEIYFKHLCGFDPAADLTTEARTEILLHLHGVPGSIGLGVSWESWVWSEEVVGQIVAAQRETGTVDLPTLVGFLPSDDPHRRRRRSVRILTYEGEVADVQRIEAGQPFTTGVATGRSMTLLRQLLGVES